MGPYGGRHPAPRVTSPVVAAGWDRHERIPSMNHIGRRAVDHGWCLEAMVAAMNTHREAADVQENCSWALGNLCSEDNDACRSMVQSSQISGRNKHFELNQHFVRECYRKKIVKLLHIPTNQQIANIFTKALARPAFEAHRSKLLNGISLEAAIEGGC